MESAIIISGEPAELEPATAEDMQLVLGSADDRKNIIKRFFSKQPSKFQLKMLAQAIKDEIIRRMDQENCLYPVAPEFIKKCLITKIRNAKVGKSDDYRHFIDQKLEAWIALGSLKVYDPITKIGDVYMGLPADPLIRQTYGANYKFSRSDTTHLLFTSKGFSIVGLMSNTKFGVQIRDYFDMMQSVVVQVIPVIAAQNALLTPEQRAEVEAAVEAKWQRLANIEKAKAALALEEAKAEAAQALEEAKAEAAQALEEAKAEAAQALEEAKVEAEQELEEERTSSALALTNYPKDHFEETEDASIASYAEPIKIAGRGDQHFMVIYLKKIYRGRVRNRIFSHHVFKICTGNNPDLTMRTLNPANSPNPEAKLVFQVKVRDISDFKKEIKSYLVLKNLAISTFNGENVRYHFRTKFGDNLQSILTRIIAIGYHHLAPNAVGQRLEQNMQLEQALEPFVGQMEHWHNDRDADADMRMYFEGQLRELNDRVHQNDVAMNCKLDRLLKLMQTSPGDRQMQSDDDSSDAEPQTDNDDDDDVDANNADANDDTETN